MLRRLLIPVLIIVNCFQSNSQPNSGDGKVWTIEECISYAQENSLVIKRALLTREANKVNYGQSIASLLPNINASVSNIYNFGNRRVAGTELIREENAQTLEGGIGININIFSGFQTQNLIRSNRAYYEASLAEINQASNTLSLNVAAAYLDIIYNKELLNSAELQLKNLEEQVERTEKLIGAGALPESSMLEVKALQAAEELNVSNAENALDLAKLNLQQLLLLPASTDFEIEVPDLVMLDSVPVNLTVNELYKISLATQPSIRGADLSIRGAKFLEQSVKGNRYPRLTFSAGLGSSHYRLINDTTQFIFNEFRKDVIGNYGQNLGLRLSIPIFNNWQSQSEIQQATIERKRAELNAVEIRNTLRLSIEQVYTNAKAARKRLNSTRKQVFALRESFRVNQQRFNSGAINALNFTLAKNNLNRAESDFIRAKFDYVFTLKVLDFYQDKPLYFIRR